MLVLFLVSGVNPLLLLSLPVIETYIVSLAKFVELAGYTLLNNPQIVTNVIKTENIFFIITNKVL